MPEDPNVQLIQEALEYQEEHSLEGPLFPEAQEELRRLVGQLQSERHRADRNQHHLNVERDANAKTVKWLNEQFETFRAAVECEYLADGKTQAEVDAIMESLGAPNPASKEVA